MSYRTKRLIIEPEMVEELSSYTPQDLTELDALMHELYVSIQPLFRCSQN